MSPRAQRANHGTERSSTESNQDGGPGREPRDMLDLRLDSGLCLSEQEFLGGSWHGAVGYILGLSSRYSHSHSEGLRDGLMSRRRKDSVSVLKPNGACGTSLGQGSHSCRLLERTVSG